MKRMYEGHLCDIPGVLVGHAQDEAARTGCTAILCPGGAVGGVDVRGGGPGTIETDMLRCGRMVPAIHGVLLTGGSAFGLAACAGVRSYLAQQGVGLSVAGHTIPLVTGGVIFDLGIGDGGVRPDAAMGYAAAAAAGQDRRQGRVGAGCGATVGKLADMDCAMTAGIGSAGLTLPGGAKVAALVVVNALGDVVNPDTGAILAGVRHRQTGTFLNSSDVLLRMAEPFADGMANTTLAVVATDAALNREQANRMAEIAQDGFALAIRPCHTQLDGDTVFALSLGDKRAEENALLHAACQVVARAIQNAVADSNCAIP